MAQLIKLQDYVSRYEIDVYHYPSRFIRLKAERWRQLEQTWHRANHANLGEEGQESWFPEQSGGIIRGTWDRLRQFYSRSSPKEEVTETLPLNQQFKDMSYETLIETYRQDLFHSQLKWASSSMREVSEVDVKYRFDPLLFEWLWKLPDNYFLLYYPTLQTARTAVDMDIILISPVEVYAIVVLAGGEGSVYEGGSGRFWTERRKDEQKKRVSPLLSLNRMETVVQDLLDKTGVQMPVKRIVVAPNSYVDAGPLGASASVVDERNYQAWLEKMKRQPSPVKSVQLKTAKLLLEHAETTSRLRGEWLPDDDRLS
ncbi:nuclease-like protein [Salsuginibacillus halophilus]|uniref:Nuclease-like protein n=1 Tax=Salsuginibacillus halophilus TaxID=517424 RepID=A0A2P8HE74_9BACI|nr:nuclease-related domain-containing protein [Salsuginibacillus halophilus]PSL44526.1 nuclease-like protein [Salsuginibacillus halophilus]